MKTARQLAAALLALACAGSANQPLSAQERLENPAGTWTHAATGTVFPRIIGAAERDAITQFDDDGKDVAVGYSLSSPEGGLILTLYVYPPIAEMDCQATYEDAKLAILDNYGEGQTIAESVAASPSARRTASALYVRYHYPAGAFRADYPAIYTDLYLHCPTGAPWLVKYRATWAGSAESFPDIAALLKQIGWGAGLE